MRKQQRKIHDPAKERKQRRLLSVRSKIVGTTERPRICAVRSNKNIIVQVIDDSCSKTLFSVQTFGKNAVQGANANKDGAKLVGVEVASGLKRLKLGSAVFDRRGCKYTGVLASLVESIRENGIQI